MFSLGTLSCSICGSIFPLSTSATRGATCETCRTPLDSKVWLRTSTTTHDPADELFTHSELQRAAVAVRQRLSSSKTRVAGVTEVDHRVLEETFCEQCKRHTACRSFARQTRSADEGQTIFFQCTVCQSEWQQNS